MENKFGVKIGQKWQENDPRFANDPKLRELTVMGIDKTHAICKNHPSGRISKIRLDRFKPNSTGYILVEDVK
jgi:hypothetical protein